MEKRMGMEASSWRGVDCSAAWMWAVDPVGTGERLRRYREYYNFSQEDLVDFFDFVGIEVSKQAISNWETGKSCPRLDKLIALADGLYNIPLDKLCVRYGHEDRYGLGSVRLGSVGVARPSLLYRKESPGERPLLLSSLS